MTKCCKSFSHIGNSHKKEKEVRVQNRELLEKKDYKRAKSLLKNHNIQQSKIKNLQEVKIEKLR